MASIVKMFHSTSHDVRPRGSGRGSPAEATPERVAIRAAGAGGKTRLPARILTVKIEQGDTLMTEAGGVGDIVAEFYVWPTNRASKQELCRGFDHMCLFPAGGSVTTWMAGGVRRRRLTVPESWELGIAHFRVGGCVVGSSLSRRFMAARMAQDARARVFLADYRFGQKPPFPAEHLDGLSTYRGLLADGVRPEGIVISGDSVGGRLASSVLFVLRSAGDPPPAVGVLPSPWADLALFGDSMSNRGDIDPVVSRDKLRRDEPGRPSRSRRDLGRRLRDGARVSSVCQSAARRTRCARADRAFVRELVGPPTRRERTSGMAQASSRRHGLSETSVLSGRALSSKAGQ